MVYEEYSHNKYWILLAAFLFTMSGCGSLRVDSDKPVNDKAVQTVQPFSGTVQLTGFGPLTYFDRACARCHGTNGANYGDTFGADLPDEELHQIVDDMAAGPGGEPLEGEKLDALVAFHRSLADKYPFVIVTERGQRSIQGEVMPGSAIQVALDSEIQNARINGHLWECNLPENFDLNHIKVSASGNGKETVVDLSRKSYSHSAAVSGNQ